MMTVSADSFLTQQLPLQVGQPLRVAVYSRLASGIRSGVFPLGAMLPRETELAAQLGISRTPVREALMLLEEDGLIRTKRGVGRFVADAIPRSGLEVFQPFDIVLADSGGSVEVRAHEFGVQQTTDFVSNKLALDSTANTWFRESVIYRASEPIALLQEHMPAGKYLSDINQRVAAELESAAQGSSSLLASLIDRCGPIFGSGICQISANVAGPSRASHLHISKNDPVLVLTQTAECGPYPVYLAKCIVGVHVGLSVIQSNSLPT